MRRPAVLRLRLAALLAITVLFAAVAFAAPAGKEPKILLFGDSLIAGLGLPPDKAFPAKLDTKLRSMGINAKIINGGVSGDTTQGGVSRLDWALTQNKPDLVVVEFGANDGFRSIDPRVIRINLDLMIQKAKAAGAKVLLAGMLAPKNWTDAYERDFNAVYPDLARTHGITLYPFFLEGVAMQPQLNQADGYHPNERGVDVIADRITPYIVRLLQQDQGGRS